MTKQIAILFPGCPPRDAAAIAEHTAVRGSGRVGRTGYDWDLSIWQMEVSLTQIFDRPLQSPSTIASGSTLVTPMNELNTSAVTDGTTIGSGGWGGCHVASGIRIGRAG